MNTGQLLESHQAIDLRNHSLKSFPISDIHPEISKLDCSSNRISTLPSNLSDLLPNLERLALSNNNITSFPITANHPKISYLDCRSNQISTLPSNLSELLPNLEKLDLSSNKFTSFPITVRHPNISELDCSGNQISTLPPNLSKLLPNLEDLSLSYNKFTSFPITALHPKISKLHGDSNQIFTLPDNIHELLPKLYYLSLSANKITHIPLTLGLISTLEICYLDNNPLNQFQHSIYSKGSSKGLKLVLQALQRSKHPLKHIYTSKWALMGNTGAGKSTLVKRLINPLEKTNLHSTHSLSFETWKIPQNLLPTDNKTPTRLKFFDFAGQDDYHKFHKIFLNQKVGIIYVFDARELFDSVEALLERFLWWKTLYDSKDSIVVPVIPVATHLDELTSLQNNEINSKFQEFVSSIITASKNICICTNSCSFNLDVESNSPIQYLSEGLSFETLRRLIISNSQNKEYFPNQPSFLPDFIFSLIDALHNSIPGNLGLIRLQKLDSLIIDEASKSAKMDPLSHKSFQHAIIVALLSMGNIFTPKKYNLSSFTPSPYITYRPDILAKLLSSIIFLRYHLLDPSRKLSPDDEKTPLGKFITSFLKSTPDSIFPTNGIIPLNLFQNLIKDVSKVFFGLGTNSEDRLEEYTKIVSKLLEDNLMASSIPNPPDNSLLIPSLAIEAFHHISYPSRFINPNPPPNTPQLCVYFRSKHHTRLVSSDFDTLRVVVFRSVSPLHYSLWYNGTLFETKTSSVFLFWNKPLALMEIFIRGDDCVSTFINICVSLGRITERKFYEFPFNISFPDPKICSYSYSKEIIFLIEEYATKIVDLETEATKYINTNISPSYYNIVLKIRSSKYHNPLDAFPLHHLKFDNLTKTTLGDIRPVILLIHNPVNSYHQGKFFWKKYKSLLSALAITNDIFVIDYESPEKITERSFFRWFNPQKPKPTPINYLKYDTIRTFAHSILPSIGYRPFYVITESASTFLGISVLKAFSEIASSQSNSSNPHPYKTVFLSLLSGFISINFNHQLSDSELQHFKPPNRHSKHIAFKIPSELKFRSDIPTYCLLPESHALHPPSSYFDTRSYYPDHDTTYSSPVLIQPCIDTIQQFLKDNPPSICFLDEAAGTRRQIQINNVSDALEIIPKIISDEAASTRSEVGKLPSKILSQLPSVLLPFFAELKYFIGEQHHNTLKTIVENQDNLQNALKKSTEQTRQLVAEISGKTIQCIKNIFDEQTTSSIDLDIAAIREKLVSIPSEIQQLLKPVTDKLAKVHTHQEQLKEKLQKEQEIAKYAPQIGISLTDNTNYKYPIKDLTKCAEGQASTSARKSATFIIPRPEFAFRVNNQPEQISKYKFSFTLRSKSTRLRATKITVLQRVDFDNLTKIPLPPYTPPLDCQPIENQINNSDEIRVNPDTIEYETTLDCKIPKQAFHNLESKQKYLFDIEISYYYIVPATASTPSQTKSSNIRFRLAVKLHGPKTFARHKASDATKAAISKFTNSTTGKVIVSAANIISTPITFFLDYSKGHPGMPPILTALFLISLL